MAIIQGNPMVQSARGALGAVMYRRVGNRTILSAKPSSPKKESEKQKENRHKFKEATYYAKHILKDPQKKTYYQQKAKKLKLPNAYTAAITDFMRKGEIKEIETRKRKGDKQDIRIKVHKKDFSINKVGVSVYDEKGTRLFSDIAIKKDHNEFIFPVKEGFSLTTGMKVRVSIDDVGSRVERSIVLGYGFEVVSGLKFKVGCEQPFNNV